MRTWSSCWVLLAALCFTWLGAEARAAVRNPKGVAVIVGNADYENRDVPDVSFARRDADAFRRYVVEVLGFDPENIIDLRDARRKKMFDALGGSRNPRGGLWSYLDPEGGSDVVVFYSGHGVPGMKDKRGYLLPVDGSPQEAEEDGYPLDLLYRNLGNFQEVRSVVVYLDAGFSGSSHGGSLTRSADLVKIRSALPKELSKKVTVLRAATGSQLASWDERARHGLFTHHLLDALYGKGDADKDGKVTAKEAKRYLDRRMTRAARRQHRRIQHASLSGAGGVVLSVAVSGGFPERSSLGGLPKNVRKEKVAARDKPPAAEQEVVLDMEKKFLVQRGLASMGFDPGPVDGIFAPKTREALRSWQKAKDYGATGRLTKEQAEVLVAAGDEAQRGEDERERLALEAKEKEESERRARAARERAEAERKAREEAERVAREEAERVAREEAERVAREKAERERKAREASKRAEAERRRARLQPGRTFRDCPECPEMVVVPAGSFMMGSPADEKNRSENEGPRHRVRIPKPFAVGVYEITRGEWRKFVSETGQTTKNTCYTHDGWADSSERQNRSWRYPGFRQKDSHPVVCVSWRDAQKYVLWLSRKTSKKYRLLSESEWEYAARGGTSTARYWGNSKTHQCRHANGSDNSLGWIHWPEEGIDCNDGHSYTSPVGSFSKNGYGLYDVLGNVAEWTGDCWNGSYARAPEDGSVWERGNCRARTLRGGAWTGNPQRLRSAKRGGYYIHFPYRNDFIGFRVARTLAP